MDEARYRAGYAGRLMGEVSLGLIDGTIFFEKHVSRGRSWRRLAVVDKNLFVGFGEMNQHKAAAANVARPGQCDRQREPCRHCRINRIAALFEHV